VISDRDSDEGSAKIPADVRQVVVRHLGAALADAWRRQHHQANDDDQGKDVRPAGSVELHTP
jgi:hypothetical protein